MLTKSDACDSDKDQSIPGRQVIVIRAKNLLSKNDRQDIKPSLLRGCKIPDNFLMLFDYNHFAIEPANFFLFDHCYRSRNVKGWINLQHAYAYDLAQYWTYLANNDLIWSEVSLDDIRGYEGALVSGISQKGTAFRAQTVQRRVGSVLEFYRWAQSRSVLPKPIPGLERRQLAPPKSRLGPGSADEKIHPFIISNLKAMLDRLGPPLVQRYAYEPRPIRDRLTAELALYTGMRVSEITALTVLDIINLKTMMHRDDLWRPVRLPLTETKGRYPRSVAVPSFLITALFDYIDGERDEILQRAKRLGKFAHGVPYALFLNEITPNIKHASEPLKADRVSRIFTQTVIECGLVAKELAYVIDPNTGDPTIDLITNQPMQTEIQIPAHTFHDLRHTFAVQLYRTELRRGNPSPWKMIQVRLGHRHMSTTQNIYLRYVDIDEADLSDNFVSFVRQIHDEFI